jgi:hypothetical protein
MLVKLILEHGSILRKYKCKSLDHTCPMNKYRIVFSSSVLPLATVAVLGVSSINARIYAQTTLSTMAPNNSPATNKQNKIQKLETQQLKVTGTTSTNENKANQQTNLSKEDYQKDLKDFQKDFLNTVFLSLLGTAISIALAILGLQFFANIFVREQDKKEVKEELKKIIKIDLEKMEQRLLNTIEQRVRLTETKLNWLEYQTVVLSAEQLEQHETKFERGADILQERIRAIRVLQKIEADSITGVVKECMQQELGNIEVLLECLTIAEKSSKPKIHNYYLNLDKQIPKYNNVLKGLSKNYSSEAKKSIEYLENLLRTSKS